MVATAFAGSPLVLATLTALSLNLVFRIGIRRKVATTIDPQKVDSQETVNFIERNGAIWGARRDVVTRVEFAVQQAIEAVIEHCQPKGPIELEIGYDEFDIDVALVYAGIPLDLSGKLPTQDEILESDDGARRLAAFLLVQRSQKAESSAANGKAVLRLVFRQ